jgi:ABC-type transporter Mla MlaB component
MHRGYLEACLMLRITTTNAQDSMLLLKLEGKLFEPWIDELQRSIQVPAAMVTLDLSSLSFADAAGVQFLAELIRHGATLQGTSGFISALLHVEQS